MRGLLALSPLLLSATSPSDQCSAPVAVPQSVTAANSTYYTDGEPPKRFGHAPSSSLKVSFGQDAINNICGRPPCGLRFEGCTDGKTMALPDPFTTDAQTFARIVRHELGHVNGWPSSHGD